MRHLRKKIAGVAVLLAILLPASAAYGYSTVNYFNSSLTSNTIVEGPVRSSTVGAEMNINLSPSFGLAVGYSHVETRANSGLKFQSETVGGGAAMSHVPVSSAWNRCWWIATASGWASRPTVCSTRIP